MKAVKSSYWLELNMGDL